jgi:hypothetical protein
MPDPAQPERFLDFLARGVADGGFGTDDALAAVVPLMAQVLGAHGRGLVAPLRGLQHLAVHHGELGFHEAAAHPPLRNPAALHALQEAPSRGVAVVGSARVTADLDATELQVDWLEVGDPAEELTHPVYLPGYVSWEHHLGHHDELTDIFSLGLLLASVACGLDFTDPEALAAFAQMRPRLHQAAPHLHPVVATLIVRMTERNRHARPQELAALLTQLEHYREQGVDTPLDFSADARFHGAAPDGKRAIILTHLRDRLFEISRRNRLVYFRPTLQSCNLTEASVPLLLDIRNIKPHHLCYYHPELAATLAKGKELNLGTYLRFDDAPYLPAALDRIRQEAARDRKEFGFAQLRLALVFLRWHNLKETPEERIHSPLLLLPVELTKKKGVRDTYVLQPLGTLAEVNPAVRFHLKELYDLTLPEEVDLADPTSLDAFYALLAAQITASEPGITLTKIDQPQIDLIYERARQRLNAFNRRLRLAGGPAPAARAVDYSYRREDYAPLGLQLFLRKVRPAPSPFDDLVHERPQPRHPLLMGDPPAPAVTERTHYALRAGSVDNPYVWDFDLCAVTLGNFNYRKMSLVRDYARLLESATDNPAFDAVFSLQPKERFAEDTPPPAPRDLHLIVPSDPTQTQAIARARSGHCYIIQGPPGTGKSQTITNLIADYAARGGRVLFVCEKRAAIDVVYHRLRQQGLDRLAVLIHDSQTDKKAFIADLRAGYDLVQQSAWSGTLEEERAAALTDLERELGILRHFSVAMSAHNEQAGTALRALFHRLVELRGEIPALSPLAQELVPHYHVWRDYGAVVRRLLETLRELGEPPVFAEHPLRHLHADAVRADVPLASIQTALTQAQTLLARIQETLAAGGLSPDRWDSLDALLALAGYLAAIRAWTEHRPLRLVDPTTPEAKACERLVKEYETRRKRLEKAQRATTYWREKLSPADTEAALAGARALEPSLLRFVTPAWYRLHRVVAAHYDFTRHAVRPPLVKLLEGLAAEHQAAQAFAEAEEQVTATYGGASVPELLEALDALRRQLQAVPPPVRDFHAALLVQATPEAPVRALTPLQEDVEALMSALQSFLTEPQGRSLTGLRAELAAVEAGLAHFHDLQPDLLALGAVPASLDRALRTLPVTGEALEAAMAAKTLDDVYRTDRTVQRFDGRLLERHRAALEAAYTRWMRLNGAGIVEAVGRHAQARIHLSSQPAAQLTPEQKLFKARYVRGRRDLEHEFGKTVRFKSIRDLVEGDSGEVVFDLKPIWLMSPVSVADTLPLQADHFDVVIFDEASQIRLEEAVPALFRARQVIVVGDEMQLPPTNFFAAGRSEDEGVLIDDGGELVEYALSADSLLSHASRNLPATLLGWHYRSREEALISFCNNAFYRGELLTVPDRALPAADIGELRVAEPADVRRGCDALLDRGVSFHYLPAAVYAKRCNVREADYIAGLVHALLTRETGMSLGIVAFSEAQQGEIEAALARRGADDPDFRNRLETEMEREDDGQFCGLFVKNLENVQGDERDVIILSVCYGRDPTGRLLMNFGPINQAGGEKRLNVIFSRARRHMVVVSSLRHTDITNEYNDGANCLRHYLEYAAAVSCGDAATARRVLHTLSPARAGTADAQGRDAVIAGLQAALSARGYLVDAHVGQSQFRCDLAVRRPGEPAYRLGILVDTAAHYATPNLLERYLLRPGILTAFGWQIAFVLSKDWFHAPDDVVARLEGMLGDSTTDGREEPPQRGASS